MNVSLGELTNCANAVNSVPRLMMGSGRVRLGLEQVVLPHKEAQRALPQRQVFPPVSAATSVGP